MQYQPQRPPMQGAPSMRPMQQQPQQMMRMPPQGVQQMQRGVAPQTFYPRPMMNPGAPVQSAEPREQEYARQIKEKEEGEPKPTTPAAPAVAVESDPVLVVVKGLVVLGFLISTQFVPVDLRFIWLLLIGLLVVGEMGLAIFHAWIDSQDNSATAMWVLYIVTGLFASVFVALLGFLCIKLVTVLQAENRAKLSASALENAMANKHRSSTRQVSVQQQPFFPPQPPARDYEQYVERNDHSDDFDYSQDRHQN